MSYPRVFALGLCLMLSSIFVACSTGSGGGGPDRPGAGGAPQPFVLQEPALECPAGSQPDVRLHWSTSSMADAYSVLQNGTVIGNTSASTTEFTHRSVLPGQTYTYSIRATNASGSTDSPTRTITIPADACNQTGPGEQPHTGSGTATSVSAGAWSSMALLQDGTVLTWGRNVSSIPSPVSGLSGVNSISAGNDFFVASLHDGSVWAWGKNGDGQLGNGTYTDSQAPTHVINVGNVTQVSAGRSHTLALAGGTVYAWGTNGFGQLGNRSAGERQATALPVTGLADVISVAAGSNHSLALRNDGSVWAWGLNQNGQTGTGSTFKRLGEPVRVLGLRNVKAIAAGGSHSLALTNDGSVYAWGSNSHGQLGNGSTKDQILPEKLFQLNNITAVSAGSQHSLALTSGQTVWTWGANEAGQLGIGSMAPRETAPVRIPGLADVITMGGGAHHSMAIDNSGRLWAWGSNIDGQIGTGGSSMRSPMHILQVQ